MLKLLDRLLRAIDLNAWWFMRWLGLNAAAYCDLESVEGEHTLVTGRSELVSVLELGGSQHTISRGNFDAMMHTLANKLGAYIGGRTHHRVQVVLVRDNGIEALDRELTEALTPSLMTARRLQCDIEDVINTRAVQLARYCALERAYVVVWTTNEALSRVDRAAAKGELGKAKGQIPPAPDALRPVPGMPGLMETHSALIGALRNDFKAVGYHTDLLSTTEALRVIRLQVDPEWTSEDWTPSLPTDGVDMSRRMRAPEAGQMPEDASNVFWPSLARQLIPRGAEALSTQVLRIGDRLYQPVSLSLPPAKLEPFAALFERLNDCRIPYRVSFRLSGAGVDDTEIGLRRIFSMFSTSRTVKNSLKDAFEDRANGKIRIGFQMDAVTWVQVSGTDADMINLSRAASRLARTIQGWGGCEVEERLGSPVTAVMSTVPALLERGVGALSVPPIEDAVALLPFTRPASPWKAGPLLFRSPDGKLYPYATSRSVQNALVTLIYAPMGGGKSVQLNALNTALVLSAGMEELPFVRILDIGPSSQGFVSLIQEGLPPSQRHLAVYRRLRNSVEDAINPCDTPLGMRSPLPQQRAFLVNFLSLLSTPIGHTTPQADVSNVIGTAIDEAYRIYRHDGRQCKRYDRNVDRAVDRVIEQLALHVDDRTTWWEVADALFVADRPVEAGLAQRHAVPNIGDIAGACNEERVRSQFGGMAANGEPITSYVYRQLTQAIREYPILARSTNFGLGAARIVSLDLAEVAPRGGAAADRQTAVMYLLGRHVLTCEFFMQEEHLEIADMPVVYRDLHLKQIRYMKSAAKRLVLDELHRASSAGPLVINQVELDIREGRKDNLEIVLASQQLDDFSGTMVDLATTIMIMGAGQKTREDTLKTFRLGREILPMLDRIGRPTKEGSRFLGIFETKNGRYVHELMLTLSSTELWAFNSTAEDRAIRGALYTRLGPAAARYVLAKAYPGGSALEDVERRRTEMSKVAHAMSVDEASASVIDTIVIELMALHERAMREVMVDEMLVDPGVEEAA